MSKLIFSTNMANRLSNIHSTHLITNYYFAKMDGLIL